MTVDDQDLIAASKALGFVGVILVVIYHFIVTPPQPGRPERSAKRRAKACQATTVSARGAGWSPAARGEAAPGERPRGSGLLQPSTRTRLRGSRPPP
eukprot:CAMPEP_0198340246 /NCGR_PEP_ID=MMETSP1450-20131203/43248_1 /TAXON_ID=753684 ORGANISM="Madagascaria erythrocladiodes, Strain CCMP3234" /NCGR_SAMPLE_ID=MMETSP1450 /ASSEMBLY_ACC=CAM_ASM_001115 /LENGTH=96 /DNA_ID=CAMNT_0044045219 /DNA_START=10 /DNA_END=297 /DNA_ORIENTATION=+